MFHGQRTKNSPFDKVPSRGDRGCDRMVYQDYAPDYALVLPNNPRRIVEMGIFRGTGLAMWGDLYPSAEIVGLDIDLARYERHLPEMMLLQAFPGGPPRVLHFDELDEASWRELELHLEPGSVDVWVDDAVHRTDVILEAWKRAEKFMAPRSVYIIEDNHEIPRIMHGRYDAVNSYDIHSRDRLTAITKVSV